MGRTLSQLLDRLDEHAAAIRDGVAEFAINVERLRTPAPGAAVAPVPTAAVVTHARAATAPAEHGLPVDPDALFAAGQGNET
jgi:hypothetical protein